MDLFKKTVKKSSILLVVSIQLFSISIVGVNGGIAMASETSAPGIGTNVTYAPCPKGSGTSKPTGSSAHTYVFNPANCIWENNYYTWDPITKAKTPRYDTTPYLNAAGTAMEHIEWNYSPAAGTFKKIVISIPVPVEQLPSFNPSTDSNSPTGSATNSASPTNTPGAKIDSNTIANTGPGSNNSINNSTANNLDYNVNNNTQLFTTLNSNATSGNASVFGNTYGGDAQTGGADAIANYLNMIQSSWNPTSGPINTFTTNLQGGYYGDILFNPSAALNNSGPNSLNVVDNQTTNKADINLSDTVGINNDINLSAVTGDATVSSNTNGGSAKSGDANAVANLFNLVNSSIMSGQSFVGNINIYDDFNGDILLSPSVLAMLKNTGPYSTNNITNSNSSNLNADINNNYSVTTNYDLSAKSGDANVSSNTNAGSATTGNAKTNIQQADIIGQNSGGLQGLLVFVNVLGKWTGALWDGTGLSSIYGSGPNSSNSILNNTSSDIDLNVNNNYEIVNNLDLTAQSGKATVSGNTNAGDATSGDATASANVVNLVNSNLTFDNWFGVLFLNVFGSWNGSFGVDTDAGNSPSNSTGGMGGMSGSPSSTGTGSESNSGASTDVVVVTSTENTQGGSGSINASSGTNSNGEVATNIGIKENRGLSSTSTGVKQFNDVQGESSTTGATTSGSDAIAWAIIIALILGTLGYANRERLAALLNRPSN